MFFEYNYSVILLGEGSKFFWVFWRYNLFFETLDYNSDWKQKYHASNVRILITFFFCLTPFTVNLCQSTGIILIAFFVYMMSLNLVLLNHMNLLLLKGNALKWSCWRKSKLYLVLLLYFSFHEIEFSGKSAWLLNPMDNKIIA